MLMWFGHVDGNGKEDRVKECMFMEVEGERPRGRQKNYPFQSG